jgi:hypothetical protein
MANAISPYRITLIALTAVLVLAMSGVAAEPTGFAEFP